MRFWDTSAVVRLCVQESDTPDTKPLLDEDPEIAAWWATRVECLGAFHRKHRERVLDTVSLHQVREDLSDLARSWIEVAPGEALRTTAERLLGAHPLRTADAFQLAAALSWCDNRPIGRGFVTLDRRLAEAARREGFDVRPDERFWLPPAPSSRRVSEKRRRYRVRPTARTRRSRRG